MSQLPRSLTLDYCRVDGPFHMPPPMGWGGHNVVLHGDVGSMQWAFIHLDARNCPVTTSEILASLEMVSTGTVIPATAVDMGALPDMQHPDNSPTKVGPLPDPLLGLPSAGVVMRGSVPNGGGGAAYHCSNRLGRR